MTGSNARKHLEAKHEHNCEQRIESIKRWVEYIESEPPERGDHNRTPSSTINSGRFKAYRRRRTTNST